MSVETTQKAADLRAKSGSKTARRTQPERSAESDRRLLAAALRLIGERGYRGTSLAAIGEAAGYSRGLAHERFGSKSGLLWAAVKHVLRVWNQEGQARANSAHVGVDALCAMIDNHRHAVEHGEGLRPFYALMFEALGPTPDLLPEFRGLHRRFRSQIEHTLNAGVAAGTMRADIAPAAQAALLMAALRGIAFQWLLEEGSFPLEQAYEELKSNLRKTLAP